MIGLNNFSLCKTDGSVCRLVARPKVNCVYCGGDDDGGGGGSSVQCTFDHVSIHI